MSAIATIVLVPLIAGIVLVSLLSRIWRAFELRVSSVEFDPVAARFVREVAGRRLRLIANDPVELDQAEYDAKARQVPDHARDPASPEPDRSRRPQIHVS